MTAKDMILAIIGRISTDGATGHVIEYRGAAIEALSMEERMTVCNMSIEGGARAGMIAPDQTTVEYLRGRRYAPQGADFERAGGALADAAAPTKARRSIASVVFDAADDRAAGDVGHQSRDGHRGDAARCRIPPSISDPTQRKAAERALEYMALRPGTSDHGYQGRPRVYRVVHQLAHERSAGRRQIVKGRKVCADRACDGGAGLAADQGRGGESRVWTASSPRPDLNGASPDAACAWA